MSASGVDVYVTPDAEVLSFDDAETGIRTLLQNQRDDRLLGRMRASALASMTVGGGRPMGTTPGRPWIEVRRKVMSGDYRRAKVTPGEEAECEDTVDAGTTAEHVDRLLHVKKSKLEDDVRMRRMASAMSPLALPEAVAGQVRNMYRNADVEALASTACGGMMVRILARGGGVTADDVQQRGIAYWDTSQAVQKTSSGNVFDIESYAAHLMSLKAGDAVVAMLDVPTAPHAVTLSGRVKSQRPGLLQVSLDDGARVLTNGDGGAVILTDTGKLHMSDGFVYGMRWKGPRFSRTSACSEGAEIVLIPWAQSPLDILPIVEPRQVHHALARAMPAEDASVSTLFDSDDVSLSIHDALTVEALVRQAVALNVGPDEGKSEMEVDQSLKVAEKRDTDTDTDTGTDGDGDRGFLLHMKLRESKPVLQMKQKQKQKQKQTKKQKGGADSSSVVLERVDACGSAWGFTTVLDALVNKCLESPEDALDSMAQGHLAVTSLRQLLKEADPSAVVQAARGRREDRGELDVTDLMDSVAALIANEYGGSRLDEEITRLMHAPPTRAQSPFDAFRSLDVSRWLQAIVREQSYQNFKGGEQTAFDADLAETRMTYEDRGFYKTFRDETVFGQAAQAQEADLPAMTILLEMLVEACGVHGLQESELSAVLRNTKHYRSDEEMAGKIRKRIELVKRAGNRPVFKERNPVSRAALQKRVIDKVRMTVIRNHTIEVLNMLGALLVLVNRLHTDGKQSLTVPKVATAIHQITQALLPSEEVTTAAAIALLVALDIKTIETDKALNGVTLIVEEDQLQALVRPRATRDAAWPHFRPMLSNLSGNQNGISGSLRAVAELQRPFLDAVPLFVADGTKPARYNVCCAYLVPSSVTPPRMEEIVNRPHLATIVHGTTSMDMIEPAKTSKYMGPVQEVLSVALPRVAKFLSTPSATWMEDALREFMDLNQSYSGDEALSRVASSDSKASWSALASQNLARFDEMSVKIGLTKDKADSVRSNLLIPTVMTVVALQQAQAQASTFLRSMVIPVLGRLSNNVQGHPDSDREALRLNAIMAAHEPGEDVSTLRSTLATYGDIRSCQSLMLVTGPSSAAALRSSVQLLMGVALTALWRILADTGGGPLGATVVKPLVLLSLDRLAGALRFALADDTVTRLIQEQKEDEKLRKIEIYKRISPEDIEAVRELRIIRDDLTWQEIEQKYAMVAENATEAETETEFTVNEGLQQEIGALGAYPDDDREVESEDADQEMMDYTDRDYVD